MRPSSTLTAVQFVWENSNTRLKERGNSNISQQNTQLIHGLLDSTTLNICTARWIRPPVTLTSRGDLQLTRYSLQCLQDVVTHTVQTAVAYLKDFLSSCLHSDHIWTCYQVSVAMCHSAVFLWPKNVSYLLVYADWWYGNKVTLQQLLLNVAARAGRVRFTEVFKVRCDVV